MRRRAVTSIIEPSAWSRYGRRLITLGPDATARQVVELVYADVDQALWWPAELSVRAQLAYLAEQRS